MLAYKDGRAVRPESRNGVDHTRCFRYVAAAISKLSARTLVLDGEVEIYDQQLRSRFDWLSDSDPDAVALPPLLPTRLRERKVINCYFSANLAPLPASARVSRGPPPRYSCHSSLISSHDAGPWYTIAT
jgi:hypothetical protein